MDITVKDLGFTVVHQHGGAPQCDIVFIHGLQGHPAATWTFKTPATRGASPEVKSQLNPKAAKAKIRGLFGKEQSLSEPTTVFWPLDILPLDFPDSRIATYGYESNVSNFFRSAANQNDITQHGNDFLEALVSFRSSNPKRPLMIISHSLGGIITKDALRRSSRAAQNDPSDRRGDVLRSTFALIFFGTPHRGGAYANLGLDLAHLAEVVGFSVNKSNVRELDGASALLSILREEFAQLLDMDTFKVTTVQESLGITRHSWISKKVVPDISSAIDHRNERKITINANHRDMCRFESYNDPGYQKVKSEIQQHVTRLTLGLHLTYVTETVERARQRCLSSLEFTDMNLRGTLIDAPHIQTLTWLYGTSKPGLGDWLENGRDVFWIQGKPGSGKSTVMKSLLQSDHARDLFGKRPDRDKWKVFGCFFTDSGGKDQQSWGGILCSMLHQLLSQFPSLISVVIPFGLSGVLEGKSGAHALMAAGKSTKFSWSEDTLENALLACKDQTELPIYILFLIDALDEHEGDHQRMGEFLLKLADKTASNTTNQIKVCVASRPLNQLKDLFGHCAGFVLQDWTSLDIEKYVQDLLYGNCRIQEICQLEESANRIRQLLLDIIGRAEGVFLWVRLVIAELRRGLADGLDLDELEETVRELPDDLQSFFQRILTKIDPRYRRDSYIIMEVVLRSRTPISAKQLHLTLRANSSRISNVELLSDESSSQTMKAISDNSSIARRVQSCCGGLVEIKTDTSHPRDSTVQFLHQTVKEFIADSTNLTPLFQDVPQGLTSSKPIDQGHDFILRVFWYWLSIPKDLRKNIKVFNADAIRKELLYHLPLADHTIKLYSTRIIDQIALTLSSEDKWGRYWNPKLLEGVIQSSTSRFATRLLLSIDPSPWTITSLAIALNLYLYLSEKLRLEPRILTNVFRQGFSCFWFLICNQDQRSPHACAAVAELLVQNGADVTTQRKYTVDGETRAMDALGVFMCNHIHCDWINDNGSHTEILHCLLMAGANPNGTYPHGFYHSPELIAYGIARLKAEPHNRVGLFSVLAKYGGNAKILDPLADVTIQSFLIENIKLESDTWLWLLGHGAKITRRMVEEFQLFTSPSFGGHPLRESSCRRPEYYEPSARPVAWSHNRHWTRQDVYGGMGYHRQWFGSWQPLSLSFLLQEGPRKEPL